MDRLRIFWDFVGLEPSSTESPRRRESNKLAIRYHVVQVRQNLRKDFSGWRPAIAFLCLFLFHSLLRLTSFLSQNKNEDFTYHQHVTISVIYQARNLSDVTKLQETIAQSLIGNTNPLSAEVFVTHSTLHITVNKYKIIWAVESLRLSNSPLQPTVRSGAEERTFWGARLDVLIFRLRSYHVLISYSAECNGPKFYKTLKFLGQAGTFLSFQAWHSSATRSSTSDVTYCRPLRNVWPSANLPVEHLS